MLLIIKAYIFENNSAKYKQKLEERSYSFLKNKLTLSKSRSKAHKYLMIMIRK
jgi:hypothetical protein